MSTKQGDLGRPYYFLGAALVLLGALYPILGYGLFGQTVWTITFWTVLLAAIHATGRQPRVRTTARLLGGLALTAGITGFILLSASGEANSWIIGVVDFLTLIFLVFATVAVLDEVLRTQRVDSDHLVGAAAAYVLLGLTFTYAFLTLQVFTDEAVLIGDGNPMVNEVQNVAYAQLADYIYYSFVSLTTLGFGDFTPGTLTARVLTGAEAIAGQLFLTVLIARLIGLHVVHAAKTIAAKEDSKNQS